MVRDGSLVFIAPLTVSQIYVASASGCGILLAVEGDEADNETKKNMKNEYTVTAIKNNKVMDSSWGWTLEEARMMAKSKAVNGTVAAIENKNGTVVEVVR